MQGAPDRGPLTRTLERMAGRVLSVNLGIVTVASWASDAGRTGIDKRPVATTRATTTGLVGDHIFDVPGHGGVDQAAYAYAAEDAAWWARELGREIGPGRFGENLTTEGVEVTGAVIGERWQVGTTVLEVSAPRIPCRVFAGFWEVPDLIKRFTAHGAPGAYLRVLVEGELSTGDAVEVVHRPAHGVTIGETFRALTLEPELLPHLLEAPELPTHIRERAARRVATQA